MNELSLRREKLFELLEENSVAILFAGAAKVVSEDELYHFNSNRNFFYLTEINQENSILMLVKGISEIKVYLFIDEYSELKEKWTGKRLTVEGAREISGITNIYSTNNFENMLSLALASENNQYGRINKIYIDLFPELKLKESYSTINFKEKINSEFPHIEVKNIYPLLMNMRMKKSTYEIERMVKAINGTNNGINMVIREMKPGQKEYDLADIFEFYGRKFNFRDLAFSTIVACGKNATCLHYPSQLDPINANEMVLFDLGYKYNGYCADISRTYPVNGVFSGKGKDVYESVLAANKAVIEYIRPGLTIKDLQEYTKQILKKECVQRGLLKEEDDITRVYYHNISHHLGLDTHDISNREMPLENGNVITVEPGLYFADLGIGVRIEDDVFIRDGRAEVLSAGIPKEVADIEKLFRSLGK